MKTKLLSAIFIASSILSYAQTTVTSSVTGKVWMDRNLGATQVATSLTDVASYGDLYQWGRAADGHQLRTSTAVAGQVAAGSEGSTFYYDGFAGNWLTVGDDTRWQIADVTNNPCPSGFRVPTTDEFNAETFTDGATAFASELKLPYAGRRYNGDGLLYDEGVSGWYWTSSISGTNAFKRYFDGTTANGFTEWRSAGLAVRCIQEATASVDDVLLLDFKMYPNPVNNGTEINFKVSNAVKNVKVFVYDVTGKEIHKQDSEARTINLSGASRGLYLVKFVLDNEATIVKELIIK
ncbi:MAG: T9SS type A sorting domain-containing protein [Flavobacteriaceae bacterium]|tara:strand:- start:4011 stop:4889 length:879 start_codon:yes stop_codon:yes gene_type:complete